MADTPKEGETGTNPVKEEELKNEQANQGKPKETEVKTEDTAVEELRKKLEQQEMRANQLANKLKAKEEAEEEATRKQLEQKEEFKSLYEQEQAKREELERTIEEEKKKKSLEKVSEGIFSEYSEDVRALADEVGLTLTDDSEEAQQLLKDKLDKINSKVVKTSEPKPNNPNPGQKTVTLDEGEIREALRSDEGFDELVRRRFPGISSMTKQS